MDAFVWNIDPTILNLGPLKLRYYGIIFASMLYIGFILWKHQALRGGISEKVADKYLLFGIIGVLAGSRLGHCLFYEPERYLADPITILYFWKGGLASHGATIGLVLALSVYALKTGFSPWESLDRFAQSAAVGAASVRLGNFFNSEIVGRPTDLPWAVRFPRHDCRSAELCAAAIPRHPSQLYEFALGLLVLLGLYLADRWAGKEKRPLGLLCGLFFVFYFSGRFMVEFVKERQVEALIEEQSFLTMGQYLSIPMFLFGVAVVTWSLKTRHPAFTARYPLDAEPAAPEPKKTKGRKKRKR